MSTENQLAVVPLQELQTISESVCKSGMYGLRSPDQALTLMLLCQAEGISPVLALRRYHIIEGRPSMRADAMAGEFLAHGGRVFWHLRTDTTAAATFFGRGIEITKEAMERGRSRCKALIGGTKEDLERLIDLSMPGEETILRTYKDCEEKGLTQSYKDGKWETKKNWYQSPRQMLTARVFTEGIRLVDPGLVAGIYSEDETETIIANERASGQEAPTSSSVEERPVKGEAARLEAAGLDPAGAQPLPEQKEKPVEGRVVESAPVEQPKVQAPTKTAPEPAATASAPKFASLSECTTADLPEGEQWRAYVITEVNHKLYKNQRLDSISIENLKGVMDGWVKAFADKIAKDPKKKAEAEMIEKAYSVRLGQAEGTYPTDEEILAEVNEQ